LACKGFSNVKDRGNWSCSRLLQTRY